MEYNEFLEEIVRLIRQRVDTDTQVSVNRVLKNNQDRAYSLAILRQDENISPAICMNSYYGQYLRGVRMETIADQVMSCYYGSRRGGKFDISYYTDFERVKGEIFCKLVSYEKNQYLLNLVPHRRFLDLAVVYYYKLEDPLIGKASILIQNAHLELWNVEEDTLQHLADVNTQHLLPYEFLGIDEMMTRITGHEMIQDYPEVVKLYVLTNAEQYYGAVNMIFGSVLEEIYQRLGNNFYILPSSIHECMVLAAEGSWTPEELRIMVREINRECVDESEILGESVYLYDGEKKKVEMA